MTTYIVRAVFNVDEQTDEHLQSVQAIRDEVTSWLDGLRATVGPVEVVETMPGDTPSSLPRPKRGKR